MVTLLCAVGLERITPEYIYFMYARTNRCYNERGSRTNYVRSSILHCICEEFAWRKGKEQSEDSTGRDSNQTYSCRYTETFDGLWLWCHCYANLCLSAFDVMLWAIISSRKAEHSPETSEQTDTIHGVISQKTVI